MNNEHCHDGEHGNCDYDENGVTINTTADAPQQDEPVDIPPDQVVSKAAKRAMNKRDM